MAFRYERSNCPNYWSNTSRVGIFFAEALLEADASVAISDISSRKEVLSESTKKLREIDKNVEGFEIYVCTQKSVQKRCQCHK